MGETQAEIKDYRHFGDKQWRPAVDNATSEVHEPYCGQPLPRPPLVHRETRCEVEHAPYHPQGSVASLITTSRECPHQSVPQRTANSMIPCRTRDCGVLAWPQRGARSVSLVFLAHVLALLTPHLCIAQVQLPAVNLGETNFEDGFAAPGVFAQVFPDSYVAGERRDANGHRIPGQSRLITYSATTQLVFVSKTRVLGGHLAGELLQPLVDIDVRLPDGASSRVRGVGDLTIGGGLGWTPRRVGNGVLGQLLVVDVTVPTGSYSDKQPINIGNHFVVVDPYYAVTYERKQIEFSARLHYLWNSMNNDPSVELNLRSMQAGQAVHLNFATSYEVRKKVRVGFSGYWLQQTTDHRTNDIAVPNSEERVVGLGPGVQLGGPEVWFHLNGYVETNVRNRPSGVKVTLRISRLWPSKQQ